MIGRIGTPSCDRSLENGGFSDADASTATAIVALAGTTDAEASFAFL